MPVDFAKWRKQREQSKAADNRGGDFYSFPEGTTIVYVAPGPEALGLPYLELDVHRNVGGKMVLCFDAGSPGLWEEGMAAARAEKGVEATIKGDDGSDVPLPCDVCDFLAGGEATLAQMDSFGLEGMGRSRIRLAVVVPIGKVGRDSGGSLRREPFADGAQNPAICFFPKTVYDGLCDALDLNGDVTDPDQARYLLVTKTKRKGKGGRPRTEYDVVVDPETVRQPVRLPKSLRAKLRDQCAPGKGCDLFRVAANFLKSPDDVYNLLMGDSGSKAPEPPADGGPVRKGCFGSSVDYSPDDDECQHCAEVDECAAVADPEGKKAAPPAAEAKPQPAPVQRQAPAKVTTTKAAGKPAVVRGKPAPAPAPEEPEPAESDGTPGFDDDDIPDHQPPEEPEAPESPAEQPPAAEPKKVTPPPVTGRKSVSAEEFNRQIAARAAARAKRGPQQ